MDAECFRLTAEQVFNELPAEFRQLMENVVVVTDDFAADDILASMGVESPFELLGLYEGVPITERGAVASGSLPDMISLYRLPILMMQAERGGSLITCIRSVLIHEIGHHFGFSDAEMGKFEAGSDTSGEIGMHE